MDIDIADVAKAVAVLVVAWLVLRSVAFFLHVLAVAVVAALVVLLVGAAALWALKRR